MKKLILLTMFFLSASSCELYSQLSSPSGLRAVYEEFDNSVRIIWNDNSSNELGFYIERAEINNNQKEWEIIGETGANLSMFYDYWLVAGSKYYYRVFAFGSGGMHSNHSNMDSIFVPHDTLGLPNPPSNLRVMNIQQTSITIEWTDNADNEMGFMIARREEGDPYFSIIDTVGTDVLTYQEVELTPNTVYYYKVCAYNIHGISSYTNVVSGRTMKETSSIDPYSLLVPDKYFLDYNYPNPFNPATNIRFGIPEAASVKLTVYNSLGQAVSYLINGEKLNAGMYEVNFNAGKLSSGVYFYSIEAFSVSGSPRSFNEIKKMILIK